MNWVLRCFSLAINERTALFILMVLKIHTNLVRCRHSGDAPDLSDFRPVHFLGRCISG